MNRESKKALTKVMGSAIGFLYGTVTSKNAPAEIKLQAASALVEGLGAAWLNNDNLAKKQPSYGAVKYQNMFKEEE